jgi:glutaredoxin 3
VIEPQTSLAAMARVEIYTTTSCPYCVQAKRLLQARGISYDEFDVGGDDDRRTEVIRRSGRRTVPQIFIDERSIGGFEELAALDASGELADLVRDTP